jgi:hypothetical protein
MSAFRWFLTSVALFGLGGSLSGRGADPAPGPAWTAEQLNEIRGLVRQLNRDIELLADRILESVEKEKALALYRQADRLLGTVVAFEQACRAGVARQDLYRQFENMDRDLHALMEAVQAVAQGKPALERGITHVQAADEELHFALSAGDISEAHMKEVLQRQALALTLVTDGLDRLAEPVLGADQGRGVLKGDLHKLHAAAQKFQQLVLKSRDRQRLHSDFQELNLAWERVVGGLKALPPQESVILLRAAARVDRIHGRLYQMLGFKGKRPSLIIRS